MLASTKPIGATLSDSMPEPSYFPLVPACKAHGISRASAYRFVQSGHLETFLLGSRRMVWMESLRTLPDRIAGGGK